MIKEGNRSIFKGKKGGIMPFAREYAEERMKEFRPMTFLVSKNKYDFYNLGQITAENLSDYDSCKGMSLSQYQRNLKKQHKNIKIQK